jgi:hypothetical protein
VKTFVSFSCIGTEAYRQLGRGGTGALFGSKNLKAVACRGTGAVRVADMKGFLSIMTQAKTESLLTGDNLWAKTDGTPVLVDLTNEMGIHPTRNFSLGVNTEKSGLDSDAMKAARAGERACWSCPMACGKFTRIDGVEIEGPEYETLCLAGSNCGVNDLASIARFNRVCDDLGLDTISTGATIGLAMDMAEQGLRDFGLRFGGVPEYLAVVEEMARLSTDRGRDLALGVKRLAAKYAAEDLAVESKGMEFPAYEPRGNHGMGLAYATSERGACHLRAFTIFAENPFDDAQLAKDVVAAQNLNAIKWAMCICDFWGTITTEYLARQLSAGLGETVTAEELDRAGERIWNLLRLLNNREGFTAADDSLPKKILTQALRGGPHEGRTLDTYELGSHEVSLLCGAGLGRERRAEARDPGRPRPCATHERGGATCLEYWWLCRKNARAAAAVRPPARPPTTASSPRPWLASGWKTSRSWAARCPASASSASTPTAWPPAPRELSVTTNPAPCWCMRANAQAAAPAWTPAPGDRYGWARKMWPSNAICAEANQAAWPNALQKPWSSPNRTRNCANGVGCR